MNEVVLKIIEWVIVAFPSILAVLSFVAVFLKIRRELKETKDIVFDMKDFEEVKNQMRMVLTENAELKENIKELLEKIDRIKRK